MRAALDADKSLWAFVRSPLVLSIVTLTYQDRSADALRSAGTPEERLAALFSAYIKRMFEHRPTGRYTPAWMLHWLAWVARSMRERGQSEFHLDRLQRDWLPTKGQQRLATLVPGIVAACLQHLVIRGLLAAHGFAPVRYVRFLDEATERLFLRRAGSGYLFVHRLLLEHFADLGTDRQGAPVAHG